MKRGVAIVIVPYLVALLLTFVSCTSEVTREVVVTPTIRMPTTPLPTPRAVGDTDTSVSGRHGDWELTLVSARRSDTVRCILGSVEAEPGYTALLVQFSLDSLGESETAIVDPDWFELFDQQQAVYAAFSYDSDPDSGSSDPPRASCSEGHPVDFVSFREPKRSVSGWLAFIVPTSATELEIRFQGELDEFPPLPLATLP